MPALTGEGKGNLIHPAEDEAAQRDSLAMAAAAPSPGAALAPLRSK